MHSYFSSLANAEPVFLAVLDDREFPAGILLGVLIRDYGKLPGFLASRVVVYGGPLIRPDCEYPEAVLSMLLGELVEKRAKGSFFIQFRNFFDAGRYAGIFREHGFMLHDHLNLVLDTTRLDTVLSGISKSKLRQARKSLEAGTVVEPARSVEEVREFYKILETLYRKKIKKPLPSLQFFEEFFSFSREKGLGVILVARSGGTLIGGMVCPISEGRRMFEWYIGGLDREYRQLYPSVVVTYSAITYAAEHGIPEFDFMGMGRPEREYGVRDFKSGFGGEMINYGRYLRINNKLLYGLAKSGYRILSFFKAS